MPMSEDELREWEDHRDLEKEIRDGIEEFLKNGPARVTQVFREAKEES